MNEIKDLLKKIKKDYGDGVVAGANTLFETKEPIIPISPAIDMITGGIPFGSWVSLNGPQIGRAHV